tara:strand:+ start:1141 stop:3063 length:1923 start_codon:yes stop_codon:yes gene_type:complete
MATPLVRIPQIQGGTMYAFASGTRDLTRAFNNPDLKFDFSKYALLDLPNFQAPSSGENTFQFDNLIDYSGLGYVPNGNAGIDFAQTFQNYALNLEELLLQDDDFDSTLLSSDSEKIFFKWLEKMGSIRFKSADSNDAVYGGFSTEELNASGTGSDYEKVVKYLGTIDVNNDIQYKGNAYHEIYVNVPSSVGYTPTILFKNTNFNSSQNAILGEAEINGRNGQSHPDSNLDMETLADLASGEYNINANTTTSLGIDWDISNYSAIANDPKIDTLQDFAKKGGDFRFNAVLIYYDLYSESVPANRSTNLYGILILDNPQDNPGVANSSYVPELIKYKPNEITGLNGNAFGLKLNIKFNSSLDNVGVEVNINDFTTFSMDLFMDTTSSLEQAAKILRDANIRYTTISQKVDDLEGLITSTDTVVELKDRISSLETSFENTSANLASSSSILDLITSANQRINQIVDGTIPTEVQYNTDILFSGSGIVVDKTVPNKIKIKNNLKGYAFNKPFLRHENTNVVSTEITGSSQYDPADATNFGIWTRLKEFSNQLRLVGKTLTNAADNNINIYIDDKLINWSDGQSFKIVFEDLDINSNNINIWTNTSNGFVTQVGAISAVELSQNPYFEVVCINSATYEFEIDIIR